MDNKLRILAVDDSTINLATIEQELKSKYDVITVNSGIRALRYLHKETPDLILLDIQMALKDGIETLKDIRALENGASIPVIMLTSKQDKETILETARLGIYDYILKPFDSEDLHERIIRTLKRSGVIPVETVELCRSVKKVRRDIRAHNTRNAIAKLDAILNFQLNEEIQGRIRTVRDKLSDNDEDAARRMIGRVLKILENNISPEDIVKLPATTEAIKTSFRYILRDLEDYKIREATDKLENLLRYDLPPALCDICEDAEEYLEEFDDGTAEELIKKALDQLNGL